MKDSKGAALITGGTDGLGRAAALHLAALGYRVFAGGRSEEKLKQLAAMVRERNLPIETMTMDVCDDVSVDRAVAAVERAAPLDVLLNNAGIAISAVMEEITLEDLRRQFETNFFGVVRVTQRVLPAMRARGRGRILNMSSISGKVSWPVFGPYSASKFALEGMSDALRLELHPFGIHVALIEPGYIPTGMNDTAALLSDAYRQGAATSPYARVYQAMLKQWKQVTSEPKYTPEDCARVIQRAIEDTPPRPRYTVTRRARELALAKRIFSDAFLDRRALQALGLWERDKASG